MAACAVGTLTAAWLTGTNLPSYATALSPARRDDHALMAELTVATSRGVL
jgi:hypothetical protein